MTDPEVATPGTLRRALAAICRNCPVCEYGRRHPDAWLGRVLHHPWHADHCPLWKAERAVAARSDAPKAV
jgi:hypothetical protein